LSDTRNVELVFRLRTEGREQAEAALRSIKGLTGEVAKGTDSGAKSMTASVLAANLLGDSIKRLAGFAKEFTSDAAQYAARTQTVGVVMDQLARVNNLSVTAVRAQSQELRKLGIVNQDAISSVNRLVFAQLDLKKATDLARLAQNAAVIGGQTSTEALNGIVHGIVTRQPEVLRTYGLIVDFEGAFTVAAGKLGRELTSVEKQQIALNQVLEQGGRITGTYEASMLTAGKQITSLTRYSLEAKDAIGSEFVPALSRGVRVLTEMAHWATENSSAVATLATGLTAASAAALAFRFTPGPLPFKLGVGALAGAATAAGLIADPVDEVKANAGNAFRNIDRERARINEQLANPSTTAADAKSLRLRFEALTNGERTVIQASAEALAQAIIQKVGKDNRGELARQSDIDRKVQDIGRDGTIDLGAGRSLRRTDVLGAIQNLESPDRSGSVFNQDAYDRAVKMGVEQQNQEAFAKESARSRKAALAAELAAVKELRQLEIQRLPEFEKLLAAHTADIQNARDSGALSKKLEQTLKNQLDLRKELLGEKLAGKVPLQKTRTAFDALGYFGAQDGTAESVFVENDPGAIQRVTALAVEGKRSLLEYNVALIRAFATPGQEVQTIERVASLRIEAANQEFAIKKDTAVLSQKLIEAERSQTLELLQLRQRSNEQYRESAGRVYDALRSGGTGGLRTLITGTADVQGRALFQNLSGQLLQTAGGTLGRLGAASGLPSWLLRGTLADPQNAEIDKALALDKNTASLKDLTKVIATGAGSSSIGLSGIPGLAGGGVIPGFADTAITSGRTVASYFRGSGTNSRFGEFGFGASTAAGGLFAGLGSGQIVRGENGYVLTGNEKFGNVVGSAGIVAGAGFGVYSGIKQGGPRGIATAVGAGLGAIAAIPGPQQPFVAAAALVAGLVTGLLPDPKKQREEEINRAVASRRYEEPKGSDRFTDLAGNDTDYDSRGRVRVMQTIVINAMDAKSLMDRKQELAQAVSSALVDGGNDLGDQVRAQVSRY
jgi:hypothetical protein